MTQKNLGRLLTAMVTPFGPDGAVDYANAAALAVKLVEEGSDGIVVAGTTGESPTLSKEEKLGLLKAVKDAVGHRAAVVMGTGSNATADTIAFSKAAEAAGADALLVVNPYYNKPNQAGLYAHFQAVAEAVETPILLYNHPGRTGVSIEPPTMAMLAGIPNIVGVKDSSGSLELVSEYRRLTNDDFLIYSGDDPLTLPMLALGAAGVISVASHVAGRDIKAMLDAWAAKDLERALELHLGLFELAKVLFIAPSPAPTKHALKYQGFNVGGVRLPLVDLNEADKARVERVLASRRAQISA